MVATIRVFVAFAVIVAAWLPGPAHALTPQQEAWCQGKGGATPDQQISGCTAVIQSGEYSSLSLAIVFNNRGLAYFNKGQFDRAIQDYDQSIRLNPTDANAFDGRSQAKLRSGDKKGAEDDAAVAVTIHYMDQPSAQASTTFGPRLPEARMPMQQGRDWERVGGQGLFQFVWISKHRQGNREAYKEIISKLCRPGQYCNLGFWADRHLIPSKIPMSDAQANAEIASYVNNPNTGGFTQRLLLACWLDPNPKECFSD